MAHHSKNVSGQEVASVLHSAIIKQNPYIVQLLLLKGANLTCKDSFGRTPLLAYLQNGGEWTDVVLKHLNVSFNIECGKPFKEVRAEKLPTCRFF